MATSSLAKFRTHTSALVDVIDGSIKTFDTGPPSGDGGFGWGWQGTPGQSSFKPYAIVYPLTGGVFDGTLGNPDSDASLIWQVTCIGATREQCEWTVDTVNALLIGRPLAVAARLISRVWADMAGGGVRRDDAVQPAVYVATPRYRVESSPEGGGS